jgi:hypothetical protein
MGYAPEKYDVVDPNICLLSCVLHEILSVDQLEEMYKRVASMDRWELRGYPNNKPWDDHEQKIDQICLEEQGEIPERLQTPHPDDEEEEQGGMLNIVSINK